MNGVFLEDLRNQLADGSVVAVVGAGLSISAAENAEVASWTGLLRSGVRRCREVANTSDEWAKRATADIDSGEMDGILATAQKITDKLGGSGGPEFRLWLESTVGKLKPTSPQTLKALKDLAIPVITTNYDSLIEQVTGREPVTWKAGWRVQKVLRHQDDAIIHLHGYWKEPDSVVLGIRSYDEILGSNIQDMMRAMAGMKCMLLIGFGAGLQDPNFSALRRWIAATFKDSSYRHFRLYCEAESAAVQGVHDQAERVVLVSYGVDHKDLVQFLDQLGKTTKAAALTSSPLRDDSRPPWPPIPAPAGSMIQQATIVAKSKLTLLNNLQDVITPELYREKMNEILTRALNSVGQGPGEGSLDP